MWARIMKTSDLLSSVQSKHSSCHHKRSIILHYTYEPDMCNIECSYSTGFGHVDNDEYQLGSHQCTATTYNEKE